MSETEKKELEAPPKTAGLYCAQCGECLGQCPFGLNIPSAMRAYMYAYGYHSLRQAQGVYLASQPVRSPCGDCQECPVQCRLGFDVRYKMLDIARVAKVPDDFIKILG